MKVLVIGGTGNISRGIVAALLKRNHEVVLFNRGQHPDAPPPDVRVIHGDRRQREDFENKMRAEKFDAVIDMISYNADDAASALRAFRGRVDHFVHCSTVMTYGPPLPLSGVNIDETASLNGQSGYGLGKIATDGLLLDAHAEDGFPVTIFKPSYTHGPGMPVHRQVGGDGSWIDRLRKGKPILSAGDGLSYFQFLSSRDAGVGFAAVLGRAQCFGEVYNIVHPRARTWDEWHRTVAEALGVEAEIVHVPQETLIAISDERFGGLRGNFGHTQIYSGTKLARDVPEFQPQIPLVESLAENIAWMDKHNRIPDSDADDLEDRIIAAVRDLPNRFH
ncbi:MAG: NAD-dependent epimerase/dehydratase family protein [Candidatus Poribacteria bacterium]|nr:NAD-dependent epimerase/dehydratase family protein [Candidatus Poribacteria bacterium]